jgi:hypothetical protein
MAAAVRALPSHRPPPDFLRAVRAKLATPATRQHWWPVPLGAIGVVAALVAATVLLRPPPTSPPAGSPPELEAPTGTPAAAAPAPSAPRRLLGKAASDRVAESTAIAAEDRWENAQAGAEAVAMQAVGHDQAVAALPARKETKPRPESDVDEKGEWPALTNEFDRVELQLPIAPAAAEPTGR